MHEAEIISLLKSRDENAFRMIVEENQDKVINACYRFVHNKEIAEDLTQDVFVEVYRSITNFRSESKLSTWIYRIAVTKSIDYLRGQKRKKRFAFMKSINESDEMNYQLPTMDSDKPNTNIENEDRVRILKWALESLSDNQKIAFTLSKYEEMSYKEISDILGTTVSSVESLIHRAKKSLEKKLYKYYKNNLV